MNLRPLEDIGEDIKDIISFDIKGPVKDHHVAAALAIPYSNYGSYKKRNTPPVHRISVFCRNRGISIQWLLYGVGQRETGSAA